MKYFIQGAIATALFVFGTCWRPSSSGALAFDGGRLAFGSEISDVGAATTAIVLILAAFAFKLSAFPFHSWAPDAYETAPPEASRVPVLGSQDRDPRRHVHGDDGVHGRTPTLTARVQWLIAGVAAASIVFGNLARARAAFVHEAAWATPASLRSDTA